MAEVELQDQVFDLLGFSLALILSFLPSSPLSEWEYSPCNMCWNRGVFVLLCFNIKVRGYELVLCLKRDFRPWTFKQCLNY